MKYAFTLLFILFISGCVGDQKGHQSSTVAAPDLASIVNLLKPPPAAPAPDPEVMRQGLKSDIRTELVASSNSTQAQMSGLVNTTISKLAEKLVGVEAQIESLVKVQTEISNTANVRADTTIKAVADLRSEITASLQVSAKLDANVAATLELKNTIGNIQAQLSAMATANANAQVGLKNDMTNTISTLKNDISSGRDVTQNYLPKEAVDIVNAANKTTQYVMAGAFALMTTLLGFMYKSKATQATEATQKLSRAMQHVPADKVREIEKPSNI